MGFVEFIILFFKVLVPIATIILIVKAYLKNKTIETKRFQIEKMIDDIKCAMIHSDDQILNQEISIRIKRITQRINDFTKNQVIAGEFMSFLMVYMCSNRQYNLIANELDEHLETLKKLQTLLPNSIT
ncbi:hypothetical protein S231_01950 [Candidatus Phytoplasma solani]|nr:hypothetical protein S231_01950 [Candidatus Phytoplasma solani]